MAAYEPQENQSHPWTGKERRYRIGHPITGAGP